jgi:beta-phosphoglucomutase-like phosphatase (HAD superfamily)
MPIRAMIFDLDGTLVKTEELKALSYAKAAVELCPYTISEEAVIEAFSGLAGLSRKEVALLLIEKFDLEEKIRPKMREFGLMTAWQTFVQIRLKFYDAMLDDADLIRSMQWEHNVDLLAFSRTQGCKTALATMSYCDQVGRILSVLDWTDKFDFIATRDDVLLGKPDPEIYFLVSDEMGIPPEECLVIEDSSYGAQAALSAGMHVIAVSTRFTKAGLHALKTLDPRWIVDDPAMVMETVERCFAAVGATA